MPGVRTRRGKYGDLLGRRSPHAPLHTNRSTSTRVRTSCLAPWLAVYMYMQHVELGPATAIAHPPHCLPVMADYHTSPWRPGNLAEVAVLIHLIHSLVVSRLVALTSCIGCLGNKLFHRPHALPSSFAVPMAGSSLLRVHSTRERK